MWCSNLDQYYDGTKPEEYGYLFFFTQKNMGSVQQEWRQTHFSPASQKVNLKVQYWTQKINFLTPALCLLISIGFTAAIPNLFLSL